jgi:hypothetical protein
LKNPSGLSLNYFTPEHFARKKVFAMIRHSFFEYFIIFFIFLNAIHLALDTPLIEPFSIKHRVLLWIDYVTTSIFILEALLKIFALGFLTNGEQSYLR